MRTIGVICMIVGVAFVLSGFVVMQQTAQQPRPAPEHVLPSPTPSSSASSAASTPTAIPYPSYQDAEAVITYYYVKKSDFAGKNVIQHFDSVTYGTQVGEAAHPQFTACAEYQYALVDTPTVPVATVRHTFTFQYQNQNEGWIVIDMGNLNSC